MQQTLEVMPVTRVVDACTGRDYTLTDAGQTALAMIAGLREHVGSDDDDVIDDVLAVGVNPWVHAEIAGDTLVVECVEGLVGLETLDCPAVVCLHYDIDAFGCFYGTEALDHLFAVVGDALRNVDLFAGDDVATLTGRARNFVVALATDEHRADEIFVRLLSAGLSSPLSRVTRDPNVLLREPLVWQGGIDAHGAVKPADDCSLLACF